MHGTRGGLLAGVMACVVVWPSRHALAQTASSPPPAADVRAVVSPPPDDPSGSPVDPSASPAPATTPSSPPVASAAPPAAEEQGVAVIGSRPMTAASSQVVRDRDLQLRPRSRPGDLFEVAPGLVVVQHAGGGKANQYFLRGFDADHGTDIAFSLDDVPINMVTHGHGQGYTDPHFIIPELIDRIEVREGPYFAQDGDFATAGALNLRLREAIDAHAATFEAGMFGDYRFLGMAQTNVGPVRGYLAAELAHLDGPFVHPLNFNHYNVVGRWSAHLTPQVDLALTVMSYAGAWNASGQIPSRLVGQTYQGRTFTAFDSIDPTEGGQSERHQAYLTLRARTGSNADLTVLLYTTIYRLTLFSNFTFFLRDPVHGDQIEQDDARTMAGFRATYRNAQTVFGWRFLTLVGATLRYDDIDNGLHDTEARQRLDDVVMDHVSETALGVFAEEQVVPNRYLRLVLGARGDSFDFAVNDVRPGITTPDPARNGTHQQQLVSPKASLVISPVRTASLDLDVYLNFGRGFHSNDGRGTVVVPTAALAAQCADAAHVPSGVQCPVTALTPATGYEIGTRVHLFHRLDLSVAAWLLDLDGETVWNGDSGTTQVGGPTRRLGITFEGRAEILRWLWADVDVSFVNAVYRDDPGNANAVALAPPWVLSAGLSARHPIGIFGALRLRAIGDRPADPQGTLTAQGFAIVSAQLGYRYRWFELSAHVENLFNSTWREAQFEEDSRLANESTCAPGAPCHTDIKFTPGTPFALTGRLTLYWN